LRLSHTTHARRRTAAGTFEMDAGEVDPYGYVIAAIGFACFANFFGSMKVRNVPRPSREKAPKSKEKASSSFLPQVMQARKRFNIQYPKLYAESSDAHNVEFNCIQRAHQQTLEWLALCQVLAAVNGMVFPRTAAAFLCVWTVGKLLYIQGYSSGKPSGRHVGGLVAHMGDVPLVFMSFVSANKLLGGLVA